MKRLDKWLVSGPFIIEVSELGEGYYIDNYTFPYEKYQPFYDEIKEKCEETRTPYEGDAFIYHKKEHKWCVQLMDEREDSLTWSTIGRRAVMMNIFAATVIEVPKSGEYEFTLNTTGGAVICINGQSFETGLGLGAAKKQITFKAMLDQGKNSCFIAVMNMHIHCICAFRLTSADDSVSVCEDLSGQSTGDIKRIKKELTGFFLGKSIFLNDEMICMEYAASEFSGKEYTFTVYQYDGFDETQLRLVKVIGFNRAKIEESGGRIELLPADTLESGKYIIKTECDGIEGVRHSFSKHVPVKFPDCTGFEERRRVLLDYYSEKGVAAAVLETDRGSVDEEYILQKVNEVNKRYDCADFALHELLRIYGKYSRKLSAETAEQVKKAILGFKYRSDEPGETMMFVRSENHQMSFYSCEYIAGILFPDEIFTNSGQNGLFHAFKGRYECEKWIREKGRYGFCEWYSNAYFPEDIISLVNIYDFSDADIELKQMAKSLLDFLVLLIATHSSRGVMGSVHGRCYERALMNPEDEGTGHMMWLLFGVPERLYDDKNKTAAALITGSYRPKGIFEEMARDENTLETYSRMGLYRYDGRRGVNIYCYRRKDYMLSGIAESRKGEFGAQVQAGQLLLDGVVPVYVSCFESMKSNTRPSYWSGQYQIPKTEAYKNLLVHIYRLGDGKGYTHCFFPEEKFDCICRKNGWKFGRINDAYAGVYCFGGYTETQNGAYKGRELMCDARSAVWLLVAGDSDEYGDFEGFTERISSGKMTEKDGELVWQSEAFGEVRLSWDGECTIGGKAFLGGELPLYSNRYAYAGYGDGYIQLKLDGDSNNIII